MAKKNILLGPQNAGLHESNDGVGHISLQDALRGDNGDIFVVHELFSEYIASDNAFGIINLVEKTNNNPAVLKELEHEWIKCITLGKLPLAQNIYAYFKQKIDFCGAFTKAFNLLLYDVDTYKIDEVKTFFNAFSNELHVNGFGDVVRRAFKKFVKRGELDVALKIKKVFGGGVNFDDIVQDHFDALIQKGFVIGSFGKHGLADLIQAFPGIDFSSLYQDADLKKGFVKQMNDKSYSSARSTLIDCPFPKSALLECVSKKQIQDMLDFFIKEERYDGLIHDDFLLSLQGFIDIPYYISLLYKAAIKDGIVQKIKNIEQKLIVAQDRYSCRVSWKDYISEADLKDALLGLLQRNETGKAKSFIEELCLGLDVSDIIQRGAQFVFEKDGDYFFSTKQYIAAFDVTIPDDVIIGKYKRLIDEANVYSLDELRKFNPDLVLDAYLDVSNILSYFRCVVNNRNYKAAMLWYEKYNNTVDLDGVINEVYMSAVKSLDDSRVNGIKELRGDVITEVTVQKQDISFYVDRILKSSVSENGVYYDHALKPLLMIFEQYSAVFDLSSELKQVYSMLCRYGDADSIKKFKDQLADDVLFDPNDIKIGLNYIINNGFYRFISQSGDGVDFSLCLERIDTYCVGINVDEEIEMLVSKFVEYMPATVSNYRNQFQRFLWVTTTIAKHLDCSKYISNGLWLLLKNDTGVITVAYYDIFKDKYDLTPTLVDIFRFRKENGSIDHLSDMINTFDVLGSVNDLMEPVDVSVLVKNSIIQRKSGHHALEFVRAIQKIYGNKISLVNELSYCFSYFIYERDYDTVLSLLLHFPSNAPTAISDKEVIAIGDILRALIVPYSHKDKLVKIRLTFGGQGNFTQVVKESFEQLIEKENRQGCLMSSVVKLDALQQGLFFELSEPAKINLQQLFLKMLIAGDISSAQSIKTAYDSQVDFSSSIKGGMRHLLLKYRIGGTYYDYKTDNNLSLSIRIWETRGKEVSCEEDIKKALESQLIDPEYFAPRIKEALAIANSDLGKDIDLTSYINEAVSRCVKLGNIQQLNEIKENFPTFYKDSMLVEQDVAEGLIIVTKADNNNFDQSMTFIRYFEGRFGLEKHINDVCVAFVREGEIDKLDGFQKASNVGLSFLDPDDIVYGLIRQLNNRDHYKAEKIKEYFATTLDRDKHITNAMLSDCILSGTIGIGQLRKFVSDKYIKSFIVSNRDLLQQVYLQDPQVSKQYSLVIDLVGEMVAYNSLCANLDFWLNVHDNLLFVQHLDRYTKKEKLIFAELILKPILSTKIFNSTADFAQLNKYLGYFDLKQYRAIFSDAPISGWNDFVRQALVHKHDITIPSFASTEMKQTIASLIQAPGVDIPFVKVLIDTYTRKYFSAQDKELQQHDVDTISDCYEGGSFLVDSISFGALYFDDINDPLRWAKKFFCRLELSKRIYVPLDLTIDSELMVLDGMSPELSMSVMDFINVCGLPYGMNRKPLLMNWLENHKIVVFHNKFVYDNDDWYDDDLSNDDLYDNNNFTNALIDIVEGVDNIDSKQLIKPYATKVPFDPLHQIVLSAIGFHAINQQTIKYVELFATDPNLLSIVSILMAHQKRIYEELSVRKNNLIKLYPDKADYYNAQFQKDLKHESIVFTENGFPNSFVLKNMQDHLIPDEQRLQIISHLHAFIADNMDVFKYAMKALWSRKDKILLESEFQSILGLIPVCDNLFEGKQKEDLQSMNIQEAQDAVSGNELLCLSYLLFLGFNNRTRQSNSKDLKNNLDQILNTPKYIRQVQNEDHGAPKIQPSMSFLDGNLVVDDPDQEKILQLLEKYGYKSAGRSMKIEILPKSDPRGRVCGDYTDCCMPLASEKNKQYILREDMSYFIVSIVDEHGVEDLVAQSVLVAAIPAVKHFDIEVPFDTIAIDNIEIANRALQYRTVIARAYDVLRQIYEDKKIIIGTTYNDDGGLVTGQCPLQTITDKPAFGDMLYSDCFGAHSAYVFNDPHNELGSMQYQFFGLQIDNFNNSALSKRAIDRTELEGIRNLLAHIAVGEEDGFGGMSFHDNYSSVLFKEGQYQGYVIAADYLSDTMDDALTIEQVRLDPSLGKDDIMSLFGNYFKRLNLENNKSIKRIVLKSVPRECVECIEQLTKKIIIYE